MAQSAESKRVTRRRRLKSSLAVAAPLALFFPRPPTIPAYLAAIDGTGIAVAAEADVAVAGARAADGALQPAAAPVARVAQRWATFVGVSYRPIPQSAESKKCRCGLFLRIIFRATVSLPPLFGLTHVISLGYVLTERSLAGIIVVFCGVLSVMATAGSGRVRRVPGKRGENVCETERN